MHLCSLTILSLSAGWFGGFMVTLFYECPSRDRLLGGFTAVPAAAAERGQHEPDGKAALFHRE
jgi:hypothetical protein